MIFNLQSNVNLKQFEESRLDETLSNHRGGFFCPILGADEWIRIQWIHQRRPRQWSNQSQKKQASHTMFRCQLFDEWTTSRQLERSLLTAWQKVLWSRRALFWEAYHDHIWPHSLKCLFCSHSHWVQEENKSSRMHRGHWFYPCSWQG